MRRFSQLTPRLFVHFFRRLTFVFVLGPVGACFSGLPQTILFPAIPDQITSAGPITLAAVVSSDLPASYSLVSSPGVATLAGSTLTLTGATGSVTVKATQAGDEMFDAAPAVFRSFRVGEAEQKFLRVAVGYEHSAGIRADGTLWTWGSNGVGMLGDGTEISRRAPVQVGSDGNWSRVACGEFHTAAIRTDGTLWACGWNVYGELGDGTLTRRASLVQIGAATNWVEVACGNNHTVALRADGTVWSWGRNDTGQLGVTGPADNKVPTQVGTAMDWVQIACGYRHTAAIRQDGTLWVWGWNNQGQLGDGSTTTRSSPVKVGSGRTWSQVSCGYLHTAAVDVDGHLLLWGGNQYGQLGDGGTQSNTAPMLMAGGPVWASVTCGSYFTFARKKDGTLWSWGVNSSGQLADGGMTDRSSPGQVAVGEEIGGVVCGFRHTLLLRGNGVLFAFGNNAMGQLGNAAATFHPAPSTLSGGEITCYGTHLLQVREDGSLWACGANSSGQIGDGTKIWRPVAVRIGGNTEWKSAACGLSHSVAVREDGTLWGWGSNGSGQLGIGSALDQTSPTHVGSLTTWKAVYSGGEHSVAIRTDGSLWSWGSNSNGQLGQSAGTPLIPVQVASGMTWREVACGQSHTMAIRDDETLWAWGYNFSGQLGDGTTNSRSTPVQIAVGAKWREVSAARWHTAAIRQDGTLWAWGSNVFGELGDGTTTSRSSPVEVGSTNDWIAVSCGDYHTLALRSDGSLWAWGYNSDGQLGTGDSVDQLLPGKIGDSHLWTDLPRRQGGYFSFAHGRDGTTWGFGRNDYGNLGLAGGTPGINSRSWPERAPQSFDFSMPPVLALNKPFPLPAQSSSGLPVSYRLLSGSAVLNDQTVTATGLGPIELLAFQPGDATWASTLPTYQTLTVAAGQQTIHFPALADRPAASGSFALSARASSALPVSYRLISGPATVSENMVTLTGAVGTVVIEAMQEGDAAWHAAAPVQQSFQTTILPVVTVPQSILFTPPASIYLAQSPLDLHATASSGLPVTFTLISAPAGTVLTGSRLIFTTAGRVKIRATQAGNASYLPAPAVEKTISVKPTPAVMTLIDLTQRYTATPREVRVIHAPAAVTIRYKIGAVWGNDPPVNAGSYPVEVYSGPLKKTGTLVITKAPLYLIPHDKRRFASLNNPTLTFIYSGFLGGDHAANAIQKAPVISTTATAGSPGGIYPIRITGGSSTNYQLIPASASMIVASLAGQHEALLYTRTSGAPVGKLEITVAASNKTFSGRLITAKELTPISFTGQMGITPAAGTLNGFSNSYVRVDRGSGGNAVRYDINFTLQFEGDFTSWVYYSDTATSSRETWESSQGKRVGVFSGKPAVGHMGVSSLLFTPPQRNGGSSTQPLPGGYGHAMAKTDAKGVMQLAGTLADGTPITASLLPDSNAGYQMYLLPYPGRRQSFCAANLKLKPHPDLAGQKYIATTDWGSSLHWTKAIGSGDTSYREGIPNCFCQIILDPWLPPQAGKTGVPAITLLDRLGVGGTSAGLTLSFASLPASVTAPGLPMIAILNNAAKVSLPMSVPPNPRSWKMTLQPAMGFFSGSFTVLDGPRLLTVNFSGLMRQPPSTETGPALRGAGHGLVPQVSGQLTGSTSMALAIGFSTGD